MDPEGRRQMYRRRRIVALAVVTGIVIGLVAIVGSSGSSDGPKAEAAKPPPPPDLPRGGRAIFPRFRVVAYYGAPQDPQLGELGIGSPARAAAKLERQARKYRRGQRPILPAFELISTVASGSPGGDGRYST